MHNKISRRAFCAMLLALPIPARAQQAEKMFRMVSWIQAMLPVAPIRLAAFWQELRKLGWVKGKILPSSIGLPRKKLAAYLS